MNEKKLILSGVLGNVLEWYDFGLYGSLAPILAKLFFPSCDPVTAIISALSVFAAGFLMRPVGALIFGQMGDRLGRKKALMLSVLLMAVPTTLIGFLPTYGQVGILAPILLTIVRLLQGVSVGGEYTCSISFLVEKSPRDRRGFLGSWTAFGASFGIMLGSLVGGFITSLDQSLLMAWGWRLPFFIGFLVGFFGYYVREKLEESEEFVELERKGEISDSPVMTALKLEGWQIFRTVFALLLKSAGYYILFVYMTTYISGETGIPLSESLNLNTVGMLLFVTLMPVAGHLSDRFGRKRVLLISQVAVTVMAIPLFNMILKGNSTVDFIAQVLFVILFVGTEGTIPAFLVESFPARVRASALSISYNVALGVFGGMAPVFCAFLIEKTGAKIAPAYLMTLCGIVSIIFINLMKYPNDGREEKQTAQGSQAG